MQYKLTKLVLPVQVICGFPVRLLVSLYLPSSSHSILLFIYLWLPMCAPIWTCFRPQSLGCCTWSASLAATPSRDDEVTVYGGHLVGGGRGFSFFQELSNDHFLNYVLYCMWIKTVCSGLLRREGTIVGNYSTVLSK